MANVGEPKLTGVVAAYDAARVEVAHDGARGVKRVQRISEPFAEFDRFIEEIVRVRARRPADLDDLDELRAVIEAFLEVSARFPALGRLMNQEGAEPSARLDYVIETVVRPQLSQVTDLVDRLVADAQRKGTGLH